jgi:hypothetical protein
MNTCLDMKVAGETGLHKKANDRYESKNPGM